jgi:two-component system, chemotaxis family, chemotaxis protein CheY
MNTLVVDDSSLIRCVIRRALVELGVPVCDEASNAAQAINMISETPYHLAIVDWNMPGDSGIEVIRALRAAGNKCPIVMQSTNATKGHIMEALQAGANDYILKPFNTADLVAKLEVHVCNAAMVAL